MNCLYCQLDGFKQKIMNGWFRVRINKKNINTDNLKLAMHTKLTDNTVIHITPKTAGSKNGGMFSFIAGAVMVIVGACLYWTPLGYPMMAAGIGLMIGGVAMMMTKTPKANTNSDSNEKKSTSFSNLNNTSAQGSVMPVPCGRVMVGSRVLSQGVETMDVENDSNDKQASLSEIKNDFTNKGGR